MSDWECKHHPRCADAACSYNPGPVPDPLLPAATEAQAVLQRMTEAAVRPTASEMLSRLALAGLVVVRQSDLAQARAVVLRQAAGLLNDNPHLARKPVTALAALADRIDGKSTISWTLHATADAIEAGHG